MKVSPSVIIFSHPSLANKMQKYVEMLDQHTNAILKINKVLDMKVTDKTKNRGEVLLNLI